MRYKVIEHVGRISAALNSTDKESSIFIVLVGVVRDMTNKIIHTAR